MQSDAEIEVSASQPTACMLGVSIVLAALADRDGGAAPAWLDPIMPIARVSFGVYFWRPILELFACSLFWNLILDIDDPLLSASSLARPVGK